MAKKTRPRKETAVATPFDQARDEMFQHIMRCDVIGADPEHQAEWFAETMQYLGDRYHELTKAQMGELRTLGERFAKPPKASAPAEPDTASAA